MHRILLLATCLTLIQDIAVASGEWKKVHSKSAS